MNVIKNCFSSLKSIMGSMSCRSCAVSGGYAASKLGGGISLVKNSPVELLTYRSADLSRERVITQEILSRFGISEKFVAVRVQEDKFTDLKNKEIQGHKDTVARVRDWYNPYQNYLGLSMGKLESSSDVAKKECRNAMNVMLMEKDDFNKKILNSDNLQKQYGGNGNKSWVVAPLKDLLDKGAKVYPDESCSLRLGQPFIITLPETTKVNVDIYPVSKK
ncbi:EspJ family T3SS effector ADP-ribosyltransferase [Salmonella enterica subsp. enterica serovar Newport]|nr:EspJ family T3SS effector ADP-ribosyltransferase [Salmonella enterica]EBS0583307.1 EspJ family T3SS effector ADP-ribosyltransferase [Salmonella enterica subsp. enterica serovar Newport]ECC9542819.1 EspJ family T3SS effector ADP-ribosyltransferase [Salmonella enterica subsp. salamae]ECZ7899990.1 EspJ family T3SS effector ADP-ribosyltransferase [Salmonella enterica subsp. enterica serovar Derby]EDE2636160.1 EspJ family T3SS effector ADP-ribosyltransferase [Salmonella enterica subsp. enterica s